MAEDLRRKGYAGRTIGLKLRFDDFRTVTRDLTLAAPTGDAREIRHAAGQCLKRMPLERRLRLLGVRVGSLVRVGGREPAPRRGGAAVRRVAGQGAGTAATAAALTLPLFGDPEGQEA